MNNSSLRLRISGAARFPDGAVIASLVAHARWPWSTERATAGTIVKRVIIVALGLLLPLCAFAQSPPASGGGAWTGTLGAGPMLFPKYAGARGWQILPLPIAYIDYDDWFYVNLFRAGAYVWSSEDKKQGISLAVEPRLGFKSGDGARLAGMATRRDSLAAGPTFDWNGGAGSLSLGYLFDVNNTSRGGYLDLLLNKPFVKNTRWDISGTVELSRLDSRIVTYYFGVRPAEATPGRALYQPGPTTNVTLWVTGQYNIDKRYALMFGANASRLGDAAASSPIIERRMVPLIYLGLGINLQ